MEDNLGEVFGIRFLASEFSTGDKHPGRIDSLGLDENGTPVIIEYKLSSNQAVINQALYYLDWLVDHRGDFEMLVQKKLGADVTVDWTAPRVLCVAEDFSHYDTTRSRPSAPTSSSGSTACSPASIWRSSWPRARVAQSESRRAAE